MNDLLEKFQDYQPLRDLASLKVKFLDNGFDINISNDRGWSGYKKVYDSSDDLCIRVKARVNYFCGYPDEILIDLSIDRVYGLFLVNKIEIQNLFIETVQRDFYSIVGKLVAADLVTRDILKL